VSEQKSGEYVFIDVETTGLNPEVDEILEVAAVKFNKVGEILGTFYELCSPISGQIPKEASDINGITMEKVAGKSHYSDIRPALADFIGKRTLVGHNLKGFDIKFLKMQPVSMEDTLEMCRTIWPGKNNLTNACKRVGIKFDPTKAHGATYDVEKGMELFLTLKSLNSKTDMFNTEVRPTQVYSYSRIQLFHTCPYKWKQIYILKNKEPEYAHFIIGRVIHKIAQLSAIWCYMRTFGNRFSVYLKKKDVKSFPPDLSKLISIAIKDGAFYLPKKIEEVNSVHIGMYFYRNHNHIQTFFNKNVIEFMNEISSVVPEGEFEIMDRPDPDMYSKIVQTAMVAEHCTDPDHLNDISYLAEFFYKQKDYSMASGQVALVEKQFIFDKDWNVLPDWYSDKGYMRGVIDIIEYNGDDCVTITDYKSGRKILTEAQFKNDNQMKVYALFIHKFLPGIKTIIIKHHYIRFGKIISCAIGNVEQTAKEAEQWINESILEIEREMLKRDGFQVRRNEFCGNCYLAESNTCPLFNVRNINDITDPSNFVIKSVDDLKRAWKKIETNKMEIKNLTSKCKVFMKSCQGKVSIDGNATLDFWVKEDIEYDALKTAKLLLDKKIDLSMILRNMSISKTDFETLLKGNKLELKPEEITSISRKKLKTEFEAMTNVEATGYLNA
jgi:DNA polymerase III epsilon subunit-like protein